MMRYLEIRHWKLMYKKYIYPYIHFTTNALTDTVALLCLRQFISTKQSLEFLLPKLHQNTMLRKQQLYFEFCDKLFYHVSF